ncbi:hypothetical protein F0L74_09890 [Chitinophaga agrisoli]|uniref:Uncharacterized protein n=1 Tax=Chitinophaga agrisoli TaxID=2607653 RepID=A0A5B2VVW1_9BACT|nr:hypothetical protein [Chitinophaga agrisoli]KAA2242830.1 hypothetical protein F0L74_09890 [Chitinophaga agrisoli]
MGLDTTHDAWHGAYSAFSRWRHYIAELAGYGNLTSYQGFGGAIPTELMDKDGLRVLLSHSDCDGELSPSECEAIAKDLEELLPKMRGNLGGHIGDVKEKTEQFINGCKLAASRNETMEFN